MTYDERLQNVSVLGAAGKMGSGILLLTAIEMADLSLKPENKGKTFVLNAIDVSPVGLSGLMNYLRDQVRKAAEKKTVLLRQLYADRDDLVAFLTGRMRPGNPYPLPFEQMDVGVRAGGDRFAQDLAEEGSLGRTVVQRRVDFAISRCRPVRPK